jgi:hypothetical protein
VESRAISNQIGTELEFEWLLCLATAFQTSQRPHLAEASGSKLPMQFRRTRNRKFFEREWKKALSFARIQL